MLRWDIRDRMNVSNVLGIYVGDTFMRHFSGMVRGKLSDAKFDREWAQHRRWKHRTGPGQTGRELSFGRRRFRSRFLDREAIRGYRPAGEVKVVVIKS
jgi:hypothetical protein